MSNRKKQDVRFNLNSPIITVSKESTSFSNRSESKLEQPVLRSRKPQPASNLLPYTPPDALMFALFSAIQRKAWLRARKLCYELILCDPLRKNYRDLHYQIDQIIKVIDQRLRPRIIASRATTASSNTTNGEK